MFQTLSHFFFFFWFNMWISIEQVLEHAEGHFFFFSFLKAGRLCLPGDYLRALRVLIENSFSFGKEKYMWKVMIKSEPGFRWQHWFIHNTRDDYITSFQQLILRLSTQLFLGRPDDVSRDSWFWKKDVCCWEIQTGDFLF